MKYEVDVVRYGKIVVEADCGWNACILVQAGDIDEIQWYPIIRATGATAVQDMEE